jgi:hypothetical protein
MLRYIVMIFFLSSFSFANLPPLSKTYDAMDNLLSETNAEGETTSYDRLVRIEYVDQYERL